MNLPEHTPTCYKQPVPNFSKRSLNGPQEYVNFIPESHLRIWYNHQTENYADHYHNALEIIVCVENQYAVVANNQTFLLNPGDILFIPSFMLHELHSRPFGSRFIFLIDIDILRHFQDYKTLNPVFMVPYLCTASSQPEIYQDIHDLLMKAANIYFSHDIFWEITIYVLLLKVFLIMGHNYYSQGNKSSSDPPGSKSSNYYTIFSNLLNYIDAHYMENLSLKQVAEHIGFSKYHFSRLFKQHTHTTFHSYLCYKRIQEAQAMLTANRNLPVTDIAFQIGFNNLTSFNRYFNKYTGCSPTEYRNKLLQEETGG